MKPSKLIIIVAVVALRDFPDFPVSSFRKLGTATGF